MGSWTIDEGTLNNLLQSVVPPEVVSTNWDEIIVESTTMRQDAPLFLHAALRLAGPSTTIIVEKCDIPERKKFVKDFLQTDLREFSRYSDGEHGITCRLGPERKLEQAQQVNPQAYIVVTCLLCFYAFVMSGLRMQHIENIPVTPAACMPV